LPIGLFRIHILHFWRRFSHSPKFRRKHFTGVAMMGARALPLGAYSVMGCLHDPANVQQTSSKRNAGRLLDRVNTLLLKIVPKCSKTRHFHTKNWKNFPHVSRYNQILATPLKHLPLCVNTSACIIFDGQSTWPAWRMFETLVCIWLWFLMLAIFVSIFDIVLRVYRMF